jgi:hypothetical protein
MPLKESAKFHQCAQEGKHLVHRKCNYQTQLCVLLLPALASLTPSVPAPQGSVPLPLLFQQALFALRAMDPAKQMPHAQDRAPCVRNGTSTPRPTFVILRLEVVNRILFALGRAQDVLRSSCSHQKQFANLQTEIVNLTPFAQALLTSAPNAPSRMPLLSAHRLKARVSKMSSVLGLRPIARLVYFYLPLISVRHQLVVVKRTLSALEALLNVQIARYTLKEPYANLEMVLASLTLSATAHPLDALPEAFSPLRLYAMLLEVPVNRLRLAQDHL